MKVKNKENFVCEKKLKNKIERKIPQQFKKANHYLKSNFYNLPYLSQTNNRRNQWRVSKLAVLQFPRN